ncbi:cyclic nucleotide-binding domain-containing protein [Bacterioplanoides sp.]|uniref:cyclic nucleotide-binding domain-containing protein n=1 Tax=Bacterioplanoides sp. TaxID=2066072 RepID=UPI003B5C71FF
MYLPGKTSDAVEQLLHRLRQLTTALLEGFDLQQDSITLEGVENLYELFDKDQLFLVQDGMLHFCKNGQNLASFDEGDIVGISASFDMPAPVLRSDEYVELVPIDRDRLLRHIYSDKRRQHYWSHFLVCQNSLLLDFLSDMVKDQVRPTAGFQNISEGEVIIAQGDAAEHVYTIITGEADVFVDDVKVGEIGEEEVFGAMAVFTKEPRSATVIARTPCTIMAVPQEDFILLIEAQPQAAVNLIENLARRITALNQQLIEKH